VTTNMKPKILLVDDEAGTRFGFVRYLSASGYDAIPAEDLASAERLLASQKFDAVIIDINLPDGSGLDLIEKIREENPGGAIIVITGAGDIPLAVDAMRKGADNFLLKPVDMQGLDLFLKKSLEVGVIRKLHTSRQRLEKQEDIQIGKSPGMKEVAEFARLAAENNSPVLITGETGTGKGVIAKWIHSHSKRGPFAFVDVNCSGLKGDLLARELFGNIRGAYTSADRDRDGLLDVADRGSLFLDEIGEMETVVQAQFLKVLEEKKYRRLGDTKLQQSDFRLICATNKHLDQEMQEGRFRSDLYYRIHLFSIHVPPLRERLDDLPELARYLLKTCTSAKIGITDQAVKLLQTYPWPGNVRELKNAIERATILSQGRMLDVEHFSWLKSVVSAMPTGPTQTLEEIERVHVASALERCNGDVTKASKLLGLSRATLYRKIKEIKELA